MDPFQFIDNPVPWPNGARCAVAFTFDVDVDSGLIFNNRDTAVTRVCAASALHSEIKVGIPRLVKLFRAFGLQQTFFVPGWCLDQYPEIATALVDEGHEIGHHGYLHEKLNMLEEAEERKAIQKGIAAIINRTGKRPRGFRAPSWAFSKHTLKILLDEGLDYDSSLLGGEMPYLLADGERRMIELPVDTALDDWNQFVSLRDFNQVMPIASPGAGFEVYRAEFDAAWKYGLSWISVWHPFVTTRLSRLDEMIKLMEYMKEKGGVWFATLEQISDHLKQCMDGGWAPHVEALPNVKYAPSS